MNKKAKAQKHTREKNQIKSDEMNWKGTEPASLFISFELEILWARDFSNWKGNLNSEQILFF